MRKHYICESPFQMKDKEGQEYTLTINVDEFPDDPRNWDNMCTIVCWHNRYNLGDKHTFNDADEFCESLCYKVLHKDHDDFYHLNLQEKINMLNDSDLILIKPINMYEHGNITVSTSNAYPYNDRWDAGCIGFIYITKEKILKETLNTAENWKETADTLIEAEMTTYDDYCRGDVYDFTLTKKVIKQDVCPHCGEVINEYVEDEIVESCGGFYGDCLEDNGIMDCLGNVDFIK